MSDSNPYSHTMTAATKLVAKTKINSYRITSELDGGTINGSPSWSQTYTIKDTVTLPTPIKTGYNFLGWLEKGTSGAPNKNVMIPVGSTGDKTYVAKWEIKKFEVDVNGILDSGIIQMNTRGMGTFETYVNGVLAIRDNYYDYCDRAVPYGTEIEIKNIKAETGRTYVKSSQSLKFTVTGNVYMTLQFKTNEYTYRFNVNGGTGSMSDIKAKHGISVKIPASTFKKDYHTQTDWNTVAGGTGTKYALGGTISGYSGKDGDVVTLYAQWRKNKVSISYHVNGGKMGSGSGEDYKIGTDGDILKGSSKLMNTGIYGELITGEDTVNDLYNVHAVGYVTLVKTGYHTVTTSDWNTQTDGSGKSYDSMLAYKATDFADLKDSDKSIVLYANWKPNNYKVRYNGNGATSGTMTDSAHVYDTTKVLTRNAYARTGYTFTGWNTKADGKGTAYADGASVKNLTANKDGVVTLYAQWKVNSYTLTYDANGGTVSTSSKTLQYGDAFGILPTPKRDGHKFLGWYTSSTGGTKVSETTKIGAENTTIYAHWEAYTLSINYHGDGAEYLHDFDFDTNKELGIVNVTGKDIVKVQTVRYGSKLSDHGVLDGGRFKKTGYTADNLVMLLKGGTSISTQVPYTAVELATKAGKQDAFKTGNVSIDIYPKWTVNTYTNEIMHWAGGFQNQEGNNKDKDCLFLNTTTFSSSYNSKYVLDSSKKVTIPNGYSLWPTFGSNDVSSDGSWQRYPFGTQVTQKSKQMKFEYGYNPNTYKITYNLNGGTNNSANPTSYTVLYGVSLKNPTRTGYTFDGWYNGSTKVTGINEGKNATFSSASELYSELAKRTTGDITLTAKWTPVTYKNKIDHWAWGLTNNEGNNTDKNALKLGSTYFDAEYNSKYTMDSSLKTTIPNGFKFMSTFSTEAIDGVRKGYPIGTQVTQKSDSMRYEYGYQPITYKITYNLNGGTNNSSNPSYYNVLYGVSLKNPTRTGYTFDGWYIGGTKVTGINEGKTAKFTSADNMYQELASRKTGNITLEARWTLNKYTLSFNPNGGTVNPTSKTVSYGNPYGNLPTPTKKGSRFLGWFTEKDGGTQVSSTTTMGASNVTLYAHWNSIEYTVSFNASGEFGGLNKTYTSGQVLGLLPTPTKAGYTFLGWYYQDTSGNEVMATSQTVVTSHMELYARWEKVQEGDCTITITDNLTSGRGEYSVKINNGVAKEYSAGESFTCNKGDKIEVNACVPDLGAEPDLFDCTGPNGNSLMSGYTWRKVNRNTSILTGTVDKTGYISFYYRIIFAEEVIE